MFIRNVRLWRGTVKPRIRHWSWQAYGTRNSFKITLARKLFEVFEFLVATLHSYTTRFLFKLELKGKNDPVQRKLRFSNRTNRVFYLWKRGRNNFIHYVLNDQVCVWAFPRLVAVWAWTDKKWTGKPQIIIQELQCKQKKMIMFEDFFKK